MKTLSEKQISKLKLKGKIDRKDVKPIVKEVRAEDKQLKVIEKTLEIIESQEGKVARIATEYSDLTKQFITRLKELKKPVDVNVTVKIPKQGILTPIRKWKFTVERNHPGGYITEIRAESVE